MHRLPLLCLSVLLVIAGCTGGPLGGPATQEQPVTVVVNNTANVTQTFEVWVVKAPATAMVRQDDGSTGNYTIGQGLRSHSSGEYHVYTEVKLPESAQLHGRYTLTPGEQNQSSITGFSRNGAVVVILSRGANEIVWWASANCDEAALVGLKVTSYPKPPGGAFATYGCR